MGPLPEIGRCHCRNMISELPDEAIPEAVEVLENMVRFYNYVPQIVEPVPTETIKAKWGETYVRPVFQVEED